MRARVCLTMIVRDEAAVIERCLRSVLPIVDTWTIVDTGSTDGTQDVVRRMLADVPGELHERPWVDFGHNRSEAIELARGKADYYFFIDADDTLELPTGYELPPLTADAYRLRFAHGDLSYERICLARADLPWRFVGVLHEYPTPGFDPVTETLAGPVIRFGGDGGRSRVPQSEKYRRDIDALLRGLGAEPDNERYVFYLAQSYRDAGDLERAIETYDRRARLGGWDEEVFTSQVQAAVLSARAGREEDEVVGRYLAAHQIRPTRAEPLTYLAAHYREHGERWALARLFAHAAANIARPADVLFVDASVYDWRAKDELAIACYWRGEYAASEALCRELLGSGLLPETERERVEANLRFATDRSGTSAPSSPATLDELLPPHRRTRVVDVGANPIDGDPPYGRMLVAGRCDVVGFEPQPVALAALRARGGAHETYLPYVVGDGSPVTLHVTAASGMTSTLAPDPARLALFNCFDAWGAVTDRIETSTRRLDDIDEVPPFDLLKIDCQGGELAVFEGAREKLAHAVCVHTEVSFVPLYDDQPSFGQIDVFLRGLGFVPHHLDALKRWPIAPTVFADDPRRPGRQLLEADIVYVRDFGRPDEMTVGQLTQLAIIAAEIYGSGDLAHRCLLALRDRGAVDRDAPDRYLAAIGAGRA